MDLRRLIDMLPALARAPLHALLQRIDAIERRLDAIEGRLQADRRSSGH